MLHKLASLEFLFSFNDYNIVREKPMESLMNTHPNFYDWKHLDQNQEPLTAWSPRWFKFPPKDGSAISHLISKNHHIWLCYRPSYFKIPTKMALLSKMLFLNSATDGSAISNLIQNSATDGSAISNLITKFHQQMTLLSAIISKFHQQMALLSAILFKNSSLYDCISHLI